MILVRSLLLAGSLILGCGVARAEDFPPFNVRLGTQTFAPKYGFTSEDRLLETARRILEMGSDIIKLEMSSRADVSYSLPSLSGRGIGSLTELAQEEPSFHKVLFDLPFHHYFIWAYAHTVPGSSFHNWRNGLSASEAELESEEIYQFARFLREAFKGTGKSFYLGHWEGDWALLGSFDANQVPTPTAIQGMIDWLNIRQQAIDRAEADTPDSDVIVLQYAEVNLVEKAMRGEPTVANSVLPHATLDLVSYSAYDTQGNTSTFLEAMNHLATRANTIGPFTKDVFVGEYGFPLDGGSRTPQQQADEAERLLTAGLGWGAPFVLYWQMYDNEAEEGGGNARGFWLVDNQDRIQPSYTLHQNFLGRAHAFKNLYRYWLDRNPDEGAFDNFSGSWKTFRTSTLLDQILASPEYLGRVTPAEFVDLLYRLLLNVSDPTDPERLADVSRLEKGTARSTLLSEILTGQRFRTRVPEDDFVHLLVSGTLVNLPLGVSVEQKELELLEQLRAGTTRADLWRGLLDSEDYVRAELSIREDRQRGSETIRKKVFIDATSVRTSRAGSWFRYR